MYNMDLGELVKVNNICDATNIEIGQQIFIPEAYKSSSDQTAKYLEDFIWPVKGKVIARFQEIVQNMVNKGINIQPNLDRQVLASRSGQVVFYDSDFKGFGKTIILEHADGFMTVYSGLQEVFIKVGDRVSRGAVIAKLGSTQGEKSTYLHFEIRKGHLPQNPVFYLPS
jgi:murein DD-endopeptidase MepM/ murein hydrolase activator NlpD